VASECPVRPRADRGTKQGANEGRRQATPGNVKQRLMQVDRVLGNDQLHPAILELRLVSGRSAVRIRSPAPRIRGYQLFFTCINAGPPSPPGAPRRGR
jgi:hypothetical protein